MHTGNRRKRDNCHVSRLDRHDNRSDPCSRLSTPEFPVCVQSCFIAVWLLSGTGQIAWLRFFSGIASSERFANLDRHAQCCFAKTLPWHIVGVQNQLFCMYVQNQKFFVDSWAIRLPYGLSETETQMDQRAAAIWYLPVVACSCPQSRQFMCLLRQS